MEIMLTLSPAHFVVMPQESANVILIPIFIKCPTFYGKMSTIFFANVCKEYAVRQSRMKTVCSYLEHNLFV